MGWDKTILKFALGFFLKKNLKLTQPVYLNFKLILLGVGQVSKKLSPIVQR